MSLIRPVAKTIMHNGLNVLGFSRRNRNRVNGQLIILTYHSFCRTKQASNSLLASLPIKVFEKQIIFLKKYFHIVSLKDGVASLSRQLQEGSLDEYSKPLLSITIDDGFKDNFDNAFPVLKKYEIPATIFLATDFIDNKRGPWPTQILEALEKTTLSNISISSDFPIKTRAQKDVVAQILKKEWKVLSPQMRFERLEELRKNLHVDDRSLYPPLDWKSVKIMNQYGIDIGSHTVYHSILSDVEENVIDSELLESKIRIEEELQHSCDMLAFPDGGSNDKVRKMTKKSGYSIAVTQNLGINTPGRDYCNMFRVEIPYNERMGTFKCRSS